MNRQRKRGDRMNTELYELLTSAQLQQRETAEGGRTLLPSRFCRAEPVKGGVRGTFAVPQKADPAALRKFIAEPGPCESIYREFTPDDLFELITRTAG